MEKTKPNTTKAHIHQSKEMHCNTKKKLKPGLVASYDIQPGNGARLFSKEKIGKEGDKEKVKNKSLKGQGKHMTNKQAAIYIYIYIYIYTVAPKVKIESRAHYAAESELMLLCSTLPQALARLYMFSIH